MRNLSDIEGLPCIGRNIVNDFLTIITIKIFTNEYETCAINQCDNLVHRIEGYSDEILAADGHIRFVDKCIKEGIGGVISESQVIEEFRSGNIYRPYFPLFITPPIDDKGE
jgi:hypothetical protein